MIEQVHSLLIFPIRFEILSADDLPTLDSQSIETRNDATDMIPTDMILNPATDPADNLDEIEVVKAELSFYTTRHTEEFKRPVYDTLTRIQESCRADFASQCSVSKNVRRGENPLKQRHLSAIFAKMDYHRERDDLTQYDRVQGQNSHGRGSAEEESPDRVSPPPEAGGRWDNGPIDGGDSDSDDEEDEHDHDHHDHDHHGHDHHDHDHHDHHHDGRRHIESDVWFQGSLGFGHDGDICLYENFHKISPECQFAVRDLHELRGTYWQQEVDAREGPPPGHACFLFGFISLALLLSLIFYNLKTRKMRQQTRAVMDAMTNCQSRAQGNSCLHSIIS